MPKYLEVAAEANAVAKDLMAFIQDVSDGAGPLTEKEKGEVAEKLARLVNLGIRCSPRGVQHTVRLNAVRRAVQDLPVRVSMEERKDERTGRTYNVLVTQPVGGAATVEAGSDDE